MQPITFRFVAHASVLFLGAVVFAGPAWSQSHIQKIAQPDKVDASLPNVLLIGDSISIGYTTAVRSQLSGVANVYRPPTNCGPTTRGVEQIDQWLGDRKWDVIHFNFGLHDLKFMSPEGKNLADPDDPENARQVSPADYVANLRTIIGKLNKTGADLIWRDTTPVPQGAQGRIADDSVFYNQLAREVINEVGGIAVDPMHQYASEDPIAGQQRPANVHYTNEGSAKLAEHVAAAIGEQL
ncbi:hypothetical protein V7x_54470 [Crateriforma conspicua]|uniref:GDSL-like Lipase/Acylhydrolase n=1 Tax=Crateriforma conspicua TaxID=2527996 RepID=A0A5C6FDY0_9PLAN|nr:SGNH/GDSL hydrolase family protein [Crateriforma conspicua]TWU59673.1 hypothetical protein V7x_54470 [Crateriforma conspicua]